MGQPRSLGQRLFVGNLPFTTDTEGLRKLFSDSAVQTLDAHVVLDRETSRSRGFGFVEIKPTDLDKVMSEMNGMDVGGRPLKIDLAKERERSSGGGRSTPPRPEFNEGHDGGGSGFNDGRKSGGRNDRERPRRGREE